ncbi:uncharacterized protein LOC122086489 [Macadamia integrifolia]|uniref:uncharacterized protein LOC122086489 n=1 Tax=Macadamia integrifolia TaxID=60698 RepID=UPI001C4EEC50|nr:uncharacterized protein LOC122086489 [Macadamia integrifolia]XP_042511250.1 uncharacterized protein LOC122086489 [Macadamia integrifolia]
MVQRKDHNKLGIQADSKDDVKSGMWSLALKSSSQYQDIQDKGGTELKKKEMKKSRSIKLLDLENLEPPPTRRAKARFNKPPTSASTAAVTPQRTSMINKRDPSPNFMKHTSRSDAKERSQVSPHGYLASCPRKSPSPSPSGRNSSRMSMSPCPNGRNSIRDSISPNPSRRNSHGNSPSPSSSERSYHRKSPSPCPSGRNSNHMSPTSNNSAWNRPSPSPDERKSNSLTLSPSLCGRNSNTKPCSASDPKPVKTSAKTPSLKPVRTLTKTPSLKGGAELKRQIKRSRSIKLLGLETLESSPMEQTNSGFDGSPGNISSAAVTPGNQCLMTTPYFLPNYMKPTSSSDARKESQVSTQGSQTSPSKSPNESNFIRIKPSSASGHKPARTLTKTTSLKPVRTLTKTSSLKLQRPSMKNRPDIAQCSSLTAGRATCSSTLKDSKFPTSLTLSPGATESEGTSAMKVCPYTYCSLNGHHHAPLPLLKHFLSARRCLLKTQKSLKMKNLSPLQKIPPGKRKSEIDMDRAALNDDPKAQAADLAHSAISPVIKEDNIDFFVEIYAKRRDDSATSMGRSIQDGHDEATTDCAVNSNIPVDIASSLIHGTEIETENDAWKAHESVPNELSYSQINVEDSIDQNSNLEVEMDIPTSEQDQFIQIAFTDYQSCLIIAETGIECCIGKELEGESTAGTESEESWEEGEFFAPPSDEPDLMTMHLPEFKSPPLQDELVLKPNETINENSEEFAVEELAQHQVHTENAESFTMEYGDDDAGTELEESSLEPTDMNWEEGEFAAPPSDESDLMTMHLPEFKCPALEEKLVFKPYETINKDSEEFPVEGLAQHQIHTENVESFTMEYGDDDSETDVEDQGSGRGIPINFSGERSNISDWSDQNLFSSTEVACTEPATIMEEADGVPKPDETFNSMVYSASVEDPLDDLTKSSDEKNDEAPESENLLQEHQQVGVEFISITDVIDGALENEQESSLAFSNSLAGVDVGGDAKGKEQAEDAVELDGHGRKSNQAENSIGEEETMQVEDNMESDATEETNSEDKITSSKKDEKIVNGGNDSNQLPMTSVNLKKKIRCRRTIDEQEEPRKFNPREPQFLDIEPEPEPEKVDLRHQMMDGRKNAEEWMLDYALQQTVTKLAPARKRRVSLLVEAFEAVIPPPKCETRLPNTSAAFVHARPIQACN